MASWVSASDTQPALFLAGTHTQSCEALSGARMHSHIAALAHVFAKYSEQRHVLALFDGVPEGSRKQVERGLQVRWNVHDDVL